MYKMKTDNFDVKISQIPGTTQNFFNNTNSIQASHISYESVRNTENSSKNYRVKSAMMNLNSLNQQSPKLKSGKLRDAVELGRNKTFKPNDFSPLFSLLDVPDKKISKGTALPIQYKKLSHEEIDGMYATTRVKESNKTFENYNQDYINTENFPLVENRNTKLNTDTEKLEKEKIPTLKSELNTARIIERKIKTAKPSDTKLNLIRKNETDEKNKMQDTARDFWIPVNYREQERNIKTAYSQRCNVPNSKQIKKRMCESNVFLTKNTQYNNEHNEKINVANWGFNQNPNTNLRDMRESDIFMVKNCKSNPRKKEAIYNVSSLSNSEWHDKASQPSLLNHTSVKYHILNPEIKHIFRTKEEIFDKSGSNFNPNHRQKSLCEYRDLTRVGQPNVNKGFHVAYNTTADVFKRNSEICANFMDLHRGYKNLVDPPFGR